MGYRKKLKCILSLVLSLFMMISMIPVNTFCVFAVTNQYENMFTITVKDQESNPIKDAVIVLTPNNETTVNTWTQTTDENGVAGFEEFTQFISSGNVVNEIKYSVAADGYKSLNDIYQVVDGLENYEVILEQDLLTIPNEDYVIKGYTGQYDGKEHKLEVTVGEEYKVAYSEDKQVYTDEVPFIKDAGNKKVWVKISRDGYQEVIQEVTLEVTKISREDFSFEEKSPEDIGYKKGLTYKNVASSELESSKITYKSLDEDVATVDENGVVTFLKRGTATITALMEESTNYTQSECSYSVTAIKIPREDFGFEVTQPSDFTYGDQQNKYKNVVAYDGDGTVKYEIISQVRNEENVDDVAKIDEESGKVSILTSGTIVVKATLTESEMYEDAEAEYTLNILKADQTDFMFENQAPKSIKYGETLKNKATGGQGNGTVTYEVVEGTNVIKVDQNGKVTAIGVGTAKIQATKAEDNCYNKVATTYSITVEKATPEIGFIIDKYHIYYGTKELTVGIDLEDVTREVTYNIIEGGEVATIDSATGTLTFNSGKFGIIVVTATLKGDENFNEVTCKTTVSMLRMEAVKNKTYKIETKNGNNGWYKSAVKVIAYDGYLVSTSDEFDSEWKGFYSFNKEGVNKEQTLYFKNIKNGFITSGVNFGKYKVDTKAPKYTVKYSEPNMLEKLLEKLSFGYYKANAEVFIHLEDDASGIKKITYAYGTEKNTVELEKGKTPSFKISREFEGMVTVTVEDNAGHKTTYSEDEYTIVVDSKTPKLAVNCYENKEKASDKYYRGEAIIAIDIDEKHFFPNGVSVVLEKDGKELDTNVSFKVKNEDPTKQNAKIVLTKEGVYDFDISVIDKAGYESKAKETLIIDKTAPIINVKYEGNTPQNQRYYTKSRKATFSITDKYIDEKSITALVNGKALPLTWVKDKKNPDTLSATYTFTRDDEYNVELYCKDLAGNASNTYKDNFVIDNTAPIGTIIVNGDLFYMNIDDEYISSPQWDLSTEKLIGDVFTKEEMSITFKVLKETNLYKMEYFISDVEVDEKNIKTWNLVDNFKDGIFTLSNINEESINYVYLKITDKAGNANIYGTKAIVLDEQLPEVNIRKGKPKVYIGIEESAVQKSVHSGDVKVNLVVVDQRQDNEVTSSLNYVKWEVYNLDSNKKVPTYTNERTLYDGTNPIDEFNTKFVIDKNKNNSNNIKVVVTAIDNAGNKVIEEKIVKIDTTKPKINISYDNNSAINGKYYAADRLVKVTITDRNFDPEQTAVDIYRDGKKLDLKSNWIKLFNGTGNKDDKQNVSSYKLTKDGDYVIKVRTIDKAGHDVSLTEKEFTIDKKLPDVHVTYSSDVTAINGNYFKADRSGYITITEHNLNTDDIEVSVTAQDNGNAIAVPVVGKWTTDGDVSRASIDFVNDGVYTFDIKVTDKAGNVYDNYNVEEFVIDKTVPEIVFTGVDDRSANNGVVAPSITCTDTNFDINQMSITLTGSNRGEVELLGEYADTDKGRSFTFENFAEEKDVDDVYVLQATISDKAGNTTTKNISFSVNRFGSNYTFSKSSSKLNNRYHQQVSDVVVYETNTDELKNIKITLFKNGESISLEENKDYSINVTGGDGDWYQYVYTIFKDNFKDDGVYSFTIHSEDAAGNIAENTLDTKNMIMQFGIDTIKPSVVVANLESNTTYNQEELNVVLSVSDNLQLSELNVYLDETKEPLSTWKGEELEKILSENKDFICTVSGDSGSAHQMKIVALDSAGNEQVVSIADFYVTTNKFIVFFNNKPLFYGAIGMILAIIGCVVYLVVGKRKKEETQEE